ncbi:MAG: hypothetical protein OQK79_09115 [Rhodanobacter sp.]|nr:hypothetical protein [Rhodanobacter sp.]
MMLNFIFDPMDWAPLAVESGVAPGANGIASGAGPDEPDPDWQPL